MGKELSTAPHAVRSRLRRQAEKTKRDAAVWVDSMGYKPVEEWDIEELARGRPRDAQGSWSAPRPVWVTAAIVAEARSRLKTVAYDRLAAHVEQAIDVIHELMADPDVDAKVKLDAAKFVAEHVIGKPKVAVELDASDGVKSFLAGALVLPDGAAAHPVFDGQFTDEDEPTTPQFRPAGR